MTWEAPKTPSAHAGYRRIASKALRGPNSVPAMSDWEVFLHGFTDTNQQGDSRDIYDCLIQLFPTVEDARNWDPRYQLPNTGGCQNFQSRRNAGNWLKYNADHWDEIRPLLRCKTDRQSRAELRDFADPQNQNKRLAKAMKGAQYKGADMHLLWGGCHVPVIDIQLMRFMAEFIPSESWQEWNAQYPDEAGIAGEGWDEWNRRLLGNTKANGGSLLRNPGAPANNWVWITNEDIDLNNSAHVNAQARKTQGLIQSRVRKYGWWREQAYKLAEEEGLPVNQWHVANWLEFRAGGKPMQALRRRTRYERQEDEKRLEAVETFSQRTFGPTNFPDKAATWPLPRERYVEDASGWVDPLLGFGRGDNLAPDRWSTRPARFHDTPRTPYIRCLIEAGGGHKVIHPLTGEEMTLVQAKDSMNRYESIFSTFNSDDLPWHDESGAKQGSEYQAIMIALMTIQPMESNLQNIYKSHGSQDDGLTTEAAQAIYETMMSYLTDGPLPQLQTMEGMGIVGPDPENYRRVKQNIVNILPREINSWRDIVSLKGRLLRRFEELKEEDSRVVDAILDAEEDAIKRGMVSGDCPPPEEGEGLDPFAPPPTPPTTMSHGQVTIGPTIQGTLGPPRPAFDQRPNYKIRLAGNLWDRMKPYDRLPKIQERFRQWSQEGSAERNRRAIDDFLQSRSLRPRQDRPEPTEEEIGEALYGEEADVDQPYGDQMETDWIQDEPTDE